MAGSLDQDAGFKLEFGFPDTLQRVRQLSGRDCRQESQAADVDAENGGARAGDFAGHAQHRAVAAEYQQQIDLAGQASGVGANGRL